MKNNDFWVLTLILFVMIAVTFGWNLWLKIIVISNSVLVLIQVIYRIYKEVKKYVQAKNKNRV